MARRASPVLKVNGPITLEWPDGTRLTLSPAGRSVQPAALPRGKPGRKPSPATARLVEAMKADAQAGLARSRDAYARLLREAGHQGSANSAFLIINREAKRAFGKTLGRGGAPPKSRESRGPGKPASALTILLRERLVKDKEKDQLRDAGHYTRWAVDQPGHKMGLKQIRPIVYRELRAAR